MAPAGAKLDEVMTTAFVMAVYILVAGRSGRFSTHGTILAGRIMVTIFMLVARLLIVFLCALPDRRAKGLQRMLFMCWTRETGHSRHRQRSGLEKVGSLKKPSRGKLSES
jgi:cell volume regulation protein A